VVNHLRDATGANIFVDWNALGEAGIDRGARVSARLNNVRFSTALDVILSGVSTSNAKVAYEIAGGGLRIGLKDDLDRASLTRRVYDVGDLLVAVPDSVPAVRTTRPAPATLPTSTGDDWQDDDSQSGDSRQNTPVRFRADELIHLIRDTVASDTWREDGGTLGSIEEQGGRLAVTQTPENHRQILNLLAQLRENLHSRIVIQTRAVACDDDALAALPTEWKKSPRWRRAPIVGPGDAAVFGPDSSTTPLNEAQVEQFLRDVGSPQRSPTVTAPRVMVFGGRRAVLRLTFRQRYVRDYKVVGAEAGDGRYEPVYADFESGVVLEVHPVVYDRGFVTLALRPRITVLRGLTESPWPGRPAGSGLTVQHPTLAVTEREASAITIPDGAALLLGGLDNPGIEQFGAGAGQPTTNPVPPSAGAKGHLFLLIKPTIVPTAGEMLQSGSAPMNK
jgi:hypothetical protein